MKEKVKIKKSFHLAGIVPVAGQKLDFEFPWHDCLQPIAKNYLAVERAVVECAHAGCSNIWIVCHDDMQPLIRHRLGDFMGDPKALRRARFAQYGEFHKKYIPIFYVPVHPKDRKKRDCLGWSVLYGAVSAYDICSKISKWMKPERFYVAFPYGVYPAYAPMHFLNEIAGKKRFLFAHNGKTVMDGEYLGFTLDMDDVKGIAKRVRKEGTGTYSPNQPISEWKYGRYPTERLPVEERWSARFFSLDKIFQFDIMESAERASLDWYHNIGDWEGLCQYLGSEEREKIKRPSRHVLFYHELNPIGGKVEEDFE